MHDLGIRWSPEQTKKIEEWLQQKWGANKACQMCAVSDWAIGTNVAQLPLADPHAESTYSGGSYPCVIVICRNCGNMVLVNALTAGIVISR